MSTAEPKFKRSEIVPGREARTLARRAVPQQQAAPVQGICTSCKHMATCIYMKELPRPVLSCDLFEGYAVQKSEPVLRNAGNGRLPRSSDTRKFTGLCASCQKIETCIYPKPEGGVWHCEEYE